MLTTKAIGALLTYNFDSFNRDVQVEAPFDFDGVAHSKHFTNLDTTGRYQLTLDKSNVVFEHEEFIQVHNMLTWWTYCCHGKLD
jgi:hypothetical protein